MIMKSLLRTHIIMAIVTAVAAVAVSVAFISFFSSMKVREHRVLEARDRLASFEQNRRVFSEEAKELEAIKARTASLERNILTEESIPPLLSSLEAMAKASGVDFTITGVENAAAEGTAGRLRIDFSASGSFAAVNSFVNSIRSQAYQVSFDRFSLYASGSDGASGKAASKSEWQLLAGIDIISF